MNPTDSPKPAGWKIVPSSSKPSASYYLQSPTGKIYPTYLAAVRHLNYFDSNQEEIEILKTGLVQEGWETKPGLPMNWFTKGEDGQRLFLSHDFLEFSSFAAAYDHLFKNKTSFEVDDLTMFYSTFSKPTKSKPTFLEYNYKQ